MMRRSFGAVLLLALALLGAAPVSAQMGRITGTVTDAQSGAPLSEVQVYLVNAQLGALTRANGRYLILNVPAGSYEIRAQRIGMGTKSAQVNVTSGGTAEADFALSTEALGLDEIVVTGAAAAARRREIGNTIAQISVADIPALPKATTDLLQSAAPGIEITGSSGEMGQGKQIRLRGNSSVAMTNQPIIYVDGVRMMEGAFPTVDGHDFPNGGRGAAVTSSPLDNINPNDIERIEIIKGSAATTLYGTEASAGVIQVFTKRGSRGAPAWTAETSQGTGWVRKFGMNGVDYFHMEHYIRDSWFGGGYEGGKYSVDCVTDDPRWEGVNKDAKGACSWPGSVWSQQYDVSVRGGADLLQYFMSGQYGHDTGVLARDAMEKWNFRGNFTMTPVPDLQAQWNTAYSNQWNQNTATGNNAQGVTLNAFRQEANYFGNGDPRRIATTLENDLQNRIERFTTGATFTYSAIPALSNRFTVGYDFSQQEGRNLRNFGYEQYPQGGLTNNTWSKRILTFDYVGTYGFNVLSNLKSSFSWGGQAIGNDKRELEGWGENFPGAAVPTVSSASLTIASEKRERVWNAGFFFQNVFDITNRYFVTVGLRVDGNSAFGSGFGLQMYPKASATWVLSDEAFWKPAFGQMKLRAAYGQSGRAPGVFDAVRTWTPGGYAGQPAFVPENLGNADLGPEVTGELEVGFDGSWFDDRFTAAFTYYHQITSDALMNVSQTPSTGFTQSQLQNVGKLLNTGEELELRGAVIQNPTWGLELGLAASHNYSEVLDLGDAVPFNDLGGRIIKGYPAPVLVGQVVANPDSIGNWRYKTPDPLAGGSNVIIGRQLPTHYITPSVTVRLPGNITLMGRGEYRGGNILRINPMSISRGVRSPICFPYYVDPAKSNALKPDLPALWRERCTPSGGRDYNFDGDYFKARSLTATVPVDFAFPERFGSAVFTATLANFYMWTRELPWYDPEILSNAGANSDGFGNGSERVPAPATLRFGLRVSF